MFKVFNSFVLSFIICVGCYAQAMPASGAFISIKDGHLNYQNKRIRIWAAQGELMEWGERARLDSYKRIDEQVKRFVSLGFNGYRTAQWWSLDFDANDGKYVKGDLSDADRKDYLLSSLYRQGVWVWCDALNSAYVCARDVNIIDDSSTREQWLQAVGDKKYTARRDYWIIWDARGEVAYIKRLKQILNHVNQHTGLRWADDPAFFCWEISNEQWWLYNMMRGSHLSMPEFFQKELYGQWNMFLKNKYHDSNALMRAWNGILPGESLENAKVMLLPLYDSVGTRQADVLGIDMERLGSAAYEPRDFSAKRGSDVLEFFTRIIIQHKRKIYNAIRSEGKPDIGVSVVPILFDTGYSFSPQSLYVNSFGDAIAVGTYFLQITRDKQHSRFPFRSNLESPPILSYDNPWLEQNKIINKPTFIYETQIFNPAKYKAEFPYLLAMLGSIQDWDVVDFHYYGGPDEDIAKDTEPFNKMLRPDNASYWRGTIFKYDEVEVAAMKLAGEMFKNFSFDPVKQPTVLTFGKSALIDTSLFEWGELNPLLAPTTYRYGIRLAFDLQQQERVKFTGPVVHGSQFSIPIIMPTDQIKLDWHKGILVMDSSKAKAACGFLSENMAFKDDIKFENIHVDIPKDMPYCSTDEARYACVGLTSMDGNDICKSKHLILSAVSTSFNSGLKLNTDKWPKGNQYGQLVDYIAPGNDLIADYGHLPVLVARVGFTMKSPILAGGNYVFRDWHLRKLQEGKINNNGRIDVPSSIPVFIVEIYKNEMSKSK